MSLISSVLSRISIIITVLWLVIVSFHVSEQIGFKEKKLIEEKEKQEFGLAYLTKNETSRLNELSSRIIEYTLRKKLSPQGNIENYKNQLYEFWKLANLKHTELIYYDSDGKSVFSFNLKKIPQIKPNKQSIGKYSLDNSGDNDLFYSCDNICYINIRFSSNPYLLKDTIGTIIIRYPLNKMIRDLKGISEFETAILNIDKKYPFSLRVTINDSHHYLNNSTNNGFFKKLFESDNIKLTNMNPYFVMKTKNGNIYIICFHHINDNIIFLTAKDITLESFSSEPDLFKIFFSFSAFMLVTMLITGLLLRKPISFLQQVTWALAHIGRGDFDGANEFLKKYTEKNMPPEVLSLNNSLLKANDNLKTIHGDLSNSFALLSNQLDFTQEVIDSAGAAFIICDESHNIIICNHHSTNLLGCSSEDLLENNFVNCFSISKKNINDNDFNFQSNLVVNDKKTLISWSRKDYFSKEHNQKLYIYVGIDISQRLKLEEKIRYIAERDELTGLYNRRKFNECLITLLNDKKRFFFAYIDLNFFKVINDTLGHTAGDKILSRFAEILRTTIADKGLPARTGGDEFSAILFTDKPGVIKICDELIFRCENIVGFDNNEEFLSEKVGLSIGIVSCPDQASNEAELYSFADAAMYENKIERNSSWHMYTGNEAFIRSNKKTKFWTEIIDSKIEKGEVFPFFQGVYRSSEVKKPEFYEVLCRIYNDGELIAADKFIDIIKTGPLIIKLDMYMLNKALEVSFLNMEDVPLLVNISAHTLAYSGAFDEITSIVEYSHVTPEKIVFEITEQVEITNMTETLFLIERLRSKGFRFALDDFGTGYSSLSYLQKIPVDFVKLDKSFVASCIKENKKPLSVINIVKFIQSMDMQVIVEGVESQDHLNSSLQSGAEYLQGYFLGRPAGAGVNH